MTAPKDPNGLREALARAIDPDGWRMWDAWKDKPECLMARSATFHRDRSLFIADALIAGPLASLIAERDHEKSLGCTWRKAAEDWARERDETLERSLALLDRARAAEAEITRLKEGMEARERALGLALRFVDLAAGEGLSFDADGSRPAMDAADVCFAVAEALGIEDLDSDAYRALVACPDLATLSPKEQP